MNPIHKLHHILRAQRPAFSKGEADFVEWLAGHFENHTFDGYGNLQVRVGEASRTLFSCHTDTVCKSDGTQLIQTDGKGIISLLHGKPGQCLGADDGAGIWLMMELIRHNIPGLYIFHRDEEVGGRGSAYLARQHPELFENIDRAVAFDRKGKGDVITHQAFGRCCSDEFAQHLAGQIGGGYEPCAWGVFTDTANYTKLVAECTNISVGYENEHGPRETLDVNHLQALLAALLRVDWENLPTVRDPKVVEMRQPRFQFGSTRADMVQLIRERADDVAELLRDFMSIDDAYHLEEILDEYDFDAEHA